MSPAAVAEFYRKRPRRQRLVKHLWESGPRPVFEAMLEVEAGKPLDEVLENYARIPVEIYWALGADRLSIDYGFRIVVSAESGNG
jgi:hypothetical protein